MRSIPLGFLLAVLLLISPTVVACESDLALNHYGNDFAGRDTNDFGLILRSAQVNGCAQAAHDKLLAKLNTMPASLWNTKEWSGIPLSMILATGLILGGNGHMSEALDLELAEAASNYALKPQAGCGFTSTTWTNGNTCLEDYAIQSAGLGWITAYFRLTGRDWASVRVDTIVAIRDTLSDTVNCIHNPNRVPLLDPNRGVCNATLANLEADTTGTIEMMTLNHGYQNPAYGVGMLTHVAAAYVGLEVAYQPITAANISSSYQKMAKQLYREGNAKATPSGAFGQNCRQLVGTALTAANVGCWDPQGGKTQATGYRADFFPVAGWFDAYGYPRTLAPGQPSIWPFQTFNGSIFSNPLAMWGAGRYEAYFTMANQWLSTVNNKPPFHSRGVYRGGIKRGSNYVTSSGTGTPAATAATRITSANLTIQDLNGGNLMNGDSVAIRNGSGYYWQATNGGGSTVTAPSTGIPAYAVFTIEKIFSDLDKPIAHDDYFALRTPNGLRYLTAPVNGVVAATATSVGSTEKFRLERFRTD